MEREFTIGSHYPLKHIDVEQDIARWHVAQQLKMSLRDMEMELTPYGMAVFQEYLATGQFSVTVGYSTDSRTALVRPLSRRRRTSNTRIKMVQAKRKAMDLDQDGKCCYLKTRKASMALRKAEREWMAGKRAEMPHASDFERVPPRRRRKQERREKRLVRGLKRLMDDMNYLDLSDYVDKQIVDVFRISEQEIGESFNG